MLVRDVMTPNPHYCTLDQRADSAARAMAHFDIGCVPVVDENMSPVAMVTDRDIALASYEKSVPPQQISIREVMSHGVFSCRSSDKLSDAERTMRDWHVRRLPVVNDAGELVGLLSVNDIVLASRGSTLERTKQHLTGGLGQTLAALCRRRPPPQGVQF